MNTIILAPSASGKSNLAQRADQSYEDGDKIVNDVTGWPKVDKWWESDLARWVHSSNYFTLASHTNDKIILFNGLIDRIWWERIPTRLVIACPTASLVLARLQKNGMKRTGGALAAVTTLKEIEDNCQVLMEMGKSIPTTILATEIADKLFQVGKDE